MSKLTERQKNIIRHELSGEKDTLLYFIKRDIQNQLWDVDLEDEDITSLHRMWEFFHGQDYCVKDPETDEDIFYFEADVMYLWEAIRHGIHKTAYISDIEFDKKAICEEIDHTVKEYLEKLEEE